MSSRYEVQKPLSRRRMRNFVALDNLTAQMPLIELIRGTNPHVRVWVAYDYQREKGTYTAIFPSGLVTTVTVYAGGRKDEKVNRGADRRENNKRVRRKATAVSKGARRDASKEKY
jgi:hypothetical protein